MAIVLAHLSSDFPRHSYRNAGRRYFHRARRVVDDWFFRPLCGALHFPGSRRIFSTVFISRAVPDVVAAQSQVFGPVFCSCDGVASHVHLDNVSVYWWNLSYYENPQAIDYIFYWSGFLAFAARIAAWGKKRQQATKRNTPESSAPFTSKVLGGAIIAFGILLSGTGLHWQEPVTAFLTAPKWSADLVLWLPYWPFEPYLSLFIIGLGAMLVTKARAKSQLNARPFPELAGSFFYRWW